MFYLTTHSAHFIYGYMASRHIVKDHSDSGRGSKGMFCLTTHSTHFIYGYMKEGNVLFNDALNTVYLRLYGFRYMVKDHSDSERGNPLPPHGLLFPIISRRKHFPVSSLTG